MAVEAQKGTRKRPSEIKSHFTSFRGYIMTSRTRLRNESKDISNFRIARSCDRDRHGDETEEKVFCSLLCKNLKKMGLFLTPISLK